MGAFIGSLVGFSMQGLFIGLGLMAAFFLFGLRGYITNSSRLV